MDNCYILQYMDKFASGQPVQPAYFAIDGNGAKVCETSVSLLELAAGLKSKQLVPRNLNGHAVPTPVLDNFCARFGEFNRQRVSDLNREERKALDSELTKLRN